MGLPGAHAGAGIHPPDRRPALHRRLHGQLGSNVFPGILGRTCDRPCEPACRRGRVEKEPVAICRLKRVAADNKGDIRPLSARNAAQKNGKRIALVGAGPASLTVARDLMPLGYECVMFDGDAKGGGMMRSQIPRFRLPETVIDEEVGYILGMGVRPASANIVESLKALLADDWDAVFVGSGAPRGRDLDIPGRTGGSRQHPYRHRLAVQRVVRPYRQDRPARHRARRRQHRDGLLPHLAPARRRGGQGGRAQRLRGDEGVALGEGGRDARRHPDPQLAGSEGIHPRRRQADRRAVREGQGRVRRRRPAQSGRRPASPTCISRATTCWSRSARRTPSRGSSATSASSSTAGACRRSTRRRCSRPCPTCSSAATPRSGRRTSSGPSRTATRRRSRSTSSATARTWPTGRRRG